MTANVLARLMMNVAQNNHSNSSSRHDAPHEPSTAPVGNSADRAKETYRSTATTAADMHVAELECQLHRWRACALRRAMQRSGSTHSTDDPTHYSSNSNTCARGTQASPDVVPDSDGRASEDGTDEVNRTCVTSHASPDRSSPFSRAWSSTRSNSSVSSMRQRGGSMRARRLACTLPWMTTAVRCLRALGHCHRVIRRLSARSAVLMHRAHDAAAASASLSSGCVHPLTTEESEDGVHESRRNTRSDSWLAATSASSSSCTVSLSAQHRRSSARRHNIDDGVHLRSSRARHEEYADENEQDSDVSVDDEDGNDVLCPSGNGCDLDQTVLTQLSCAESRAKRITRAAHVALRRVDGTLDQLRTVAELSRSAANSAGAHNNRCTHYKEKSSGDNLRGDCPARVRADSRYDDTCKSHHTDDISGREEHSMLESLKASNRALCAALRERDTAAAVMLREIHTLREQLAHEQHADKATNTMSSTHDRRPCNHGNDDCRDAHHRKECAREVARHRRASAS